MHTLVTGSSGFVGGYLILQLLHNEDNHIIGLENNTIIGCSDKNRYQFYQCNIGTDFDPDIQKLLLETNIDHVFHLAAISSGNVSDADLVNAINIEGTKRLFQILNNRNNIPKIAFFSTGYVYGTCDKLAVESDLIPPTGLYGLYRDSKVAGEQIAREYGAVIFRPFNMIGPGQNDNFAISSFAKQIAEIEAGLREPVLKVGNLEAYRDFIDVRDAVRVFPRLLQYGVSGQAYNICSGNPTKIDDALLLLLSMTERKIDVIEDPARMRPSDIPVSIGNPANTYKLTGWKPEIPLRQTLSDCLNWWRERVKDY